MQRPKSAAGAAAAPMSAASQSPAVSAVDNNNYSLSGIVAANPSVDSDLIASASSRAMINPAPIASQKGPLPVQPATGLLSYDTTVAPQYQSAGDVAYYPSPGSTPIYRSSVGASSTQASVGTPAYQPSASETASPASSGASSAQSSGDTSSSQSESAASSPATNDEQSALSQSGAGIPVATTGQTNLDVTDFGASPDAVQFFVNTVSNSTVVSVAGTNIFSSADVGKVIEVFRAGPWVSYSDWGPVVTQQDTICLITNVSDGTNLSLSIPCGWTMTATCVVGTNNAPAFQAAINEASNLVETAGFTNVTINIPAGTYLTVSPYVLDPNYGMSSISDTHPAITISSGGITLLGDPSGDTILLGCGAGMEHLVYPATPITWISSGYAPYVPMRDTLVWCAGPVQNNQYPLVFQNLTLDGGVQNGAQSYNYWTPIQGNGEGWDTTHHAVADWDGYVSHQMNLTKVFTNCVFQHWRGEMLICWTGNMPGAINDIANCTFYDGNATADNMYYGQHIHGCTFNQIEKVTEYYQYNADSPTIFEDNLVTNIAGNMVVINGATTNVIPPYFTIRNNIFYGQPNLDDILFTPACNVVVSNNQFYGQAVGISFSGVGLQPSDGSAATMSNVVIVANNFNDTFLPIYTDGYPVEDVLVANNTSSVTTQFAFAAGGWKTNWVFSGNSSQGVLDSTAIQGGSYFTDESSDNLGWWTHSDYIGQTNWINYGNGSRHLINQAMANSVFAFGSNTNLLPAGAIIQVYNMTAIAVPIYPTLATSAQSTGPSGPSAPSSNGSSQLSGSYGSFASFFGSFFSFIFSQSSNSGSITPASEPADASGPVAVNLPPGQTATFVWNNGAWAQQ